MSREIAIRLAYVTDPDDGEGWRYYVSGAETGCGALGNPESLPDGAPLHEILRAAAEEMTPPALTPLQQQIADYLTADPPPSRQAIADTLQCSLSAVDQVARRVLGPGKQGRPRRAPHG